MRRIILPIFALLLTTAASAKIFKPAPTSKNEAAIILLQGASIKPAQYSSLVRKIQEEKSIAIWVGIPEVPLDLVVASDMEKQIDSILDELVTAGFKGEKIILAGHSVGGIAAQDVFLKSKKFESLILLGSFVTRKNRSQLKDAQILTVAAELDGLTRITRIAESFYHQNVTTKNKSQTIAVIEGMNHMQFATGRKPLLVRKRDLKAEIPNDYAQEQVANVISDFIVSTSGTSTLSKTFRTNENRKSKKLLSPLIDAMLLEGSHHLKKPCTHLKPNQNEPCWKESPWARLSSENFLPEVKDKIVARNEYHEVWRIFPFFHPKIENTCTQQEDDCTLSIKSISQPTYEILSALDTGFISNSASEIRVKFRSRQSVFEALGRKDQNFEETDGSSWCQKLNLKALDWALTHSSKEAIERYQARGIPMVIEKDLKAVSTGPAWIWNILPQKTKINEVGEKIRSVRSPVMKTPLSYPIKKAAGMHYCKLLSPARAMEWIYTDSLR